MRVATYNVQSGGFENYKDYESKHPPRLGAIQQAVHHIDADVIGLTDTFRWSSLYTSADLRAIFNYGHAVAVPISDITMGMSGRNIGLTVLSRREFTHKSRVNLGERNGLRTDVELNDGQILRLFTAYLNHASEHTRVEQSLALMSHTVKPELATVIADLNSVSRGDKKSSLLRKVLSLAPDAKIKGDLAELNELLKGDAHQLFVEAGFIDANNERLPSWPTPAKRILGGLALPPILRVDHILHSPDIKSSDCDVPKGEPYQSASDHFPVVAQLTV